MPPPAQVVQQPGQPAPGLLQKLGMGAMMGVGVGLTIGFIGGAFQILRAGPGPKGTMATLTQFMGTSAATFGFFMSIGTVIRTESHLNPVEEERWRIAAMRGGCLISSSASSSSVSASLMDARRRGAEAMQTPSPSLRR
ncbi:hypothetical protein K437DRAFT_253369 [Tilletiaria anomala UBC 951]|uniref:Mitochondrial genome maintenance protein Mgr2 n=1 Tax=Tilletiaria anomala (strain ATCC 24038 / CBS 436.72 / UBC 951) TaxID=1037660 RepID=A0A066WGW1_TILAU|nr:uncharacterized protein K437DRAFT_253369 [Tilletiaria anomala UBC 951]KDN53046.1 hypothetical protein K437DRAFT_253369 [Tilletiaria anomala UBC 951]